MGPGGTGCPRCRDGFGRFPGVSPALDAIRVPDPLRWPLAVSSGWFLLSFIRGVPRMPAVLPGRRMTFPRGLVRRVRRPAGPFPLIFLEKK